MVLRPFHVSAAHCKVQSGRYKITPKKDRPLTYEMANPPHFIAHRKAWNSWDTSASVSSLTLKILATLWSRLSFFLLPTGSLKDGLRPAETAVDDMFIRRFVTGTWHDLFVSEVITLHLASSS